MITRLNPEYASVNHTHKLKTVLIQSSTSSPLAVDGYTTIHFDITSHGFTEAPLVVPQSNGWLTSQVSSASKTNVTLELRNLGTSAHNGNCRALLIGPVVS